MRNLSLFSFLTLFTIGLMGQSKTLSSFSSIATSGSVEVQLVKSDQTKADYTILKGDPEELIIEVVGSELKVKIKSKSMFWNRNNTKASVTVYYKALNSISCSAGSNISSKNEITATYLDIDASSGANCDLTIISDKIKVDASSGASIEITGSANNASYDASSGARIEATGVIVANADADVSSGASIKLHVTKSFSGEASSGGSIKYKGNPEKTNIDASVSGSIKSF